MTTLAAQNGPKVIAWEAPSGPSYGSGMPAGCLSPYNSDYFYGPTGHANEGFLAGALPNISGIGVVVYWNCIDSCTSLDAPCATPASPPCTGGGWENCFPWSYLDNDLLDYINNTYSPVTSFISKHIVLIVQPESDAGGVNQVTPSYVFDSTYAANNNWNPQDVTVCSGWPGKASTSPVQGSFSSMTNDFGIWNQKSCAVLPSSTDLMCTCSPPMVCNFTDFSGFPVVYEMPIMKSYQNFLKALFKHYSAQGSATGQQIAPYILYARIGLSHGGENYPICGTRGTMLSCNNQPCSVGGTNSTWPGPQGQFITALGGEPWQTQFAYSDGGYLTQWQPSSGDGAGYTTAMMQFLNSYATFPVTIASSYGPPGKQTQFYADLEARLATQNNVGFGNQVLNIYDTVLAAAGTPSVDNWVANFKNYPYAPVHHLQTHSPGGSGMFAAGFNIDHIAYSASANTATVTCSSGATCAIFCSGFAYITGNESPLLNGIFKTESGSNCTAISTSTVIFQPPTPPPCSGTCTYNSGTIWAPDYWPIIMPFATQQKATSVEVYECDVDFAFGTTTTTGCINSLSSPNADYQNAVSNTLFGIPFGTSFHDASFYNGWQF